MKRRKLLLGLGTASATGAAAFGTGAFSAIEAERQISVNTAGDASAFLQLLPADHKSLSEGVRSPNGAYAQLVNGQLTLDFSAANDGVSGEGLNQDSTTVAREVFLVGNQGTQEVEIAITPGEESAGTLVFPQKDVLLAILPDGGTVGEPVSLDVGEKQRFSVIATVGTDIEEPPIDDTITFLAEATSQ